MTVHDQGMTWLLAQLKPNCVQIAERNFKRQGFRTFLPKEEGTVRRGGRFVNAALPLFPGYLFVAINVATAQWRSISSTYGLTRLVSFGLQPAPVPLAIVSQLMLSCDAAGKLLPPRLLKPEEQVRVTSGPFAEFVAEVEAIAPDRRVWVLMQLMGVRTRVAMRADQLRVV